MKMDLSTHDPVPMLAAMSALAALDTVDDISSEVLTLADAMTLKEALLTRRGATHEVILRASLHHSASGVELHRLFVVFLRRRRLGVSGRMPGRDHSRKVRS